MNALRCRFDDGRLNTLFFASFVAVTDAKLIGQPKIMKVKSIECRNAPFIVSFIHVIRASLSIVIEHRCVSLRCLHCHLFYVVDMTLDSPKMNATLEGKFGKRMSEKRTHSNSTLCSACVPRATPPRTKRVSDGQRGTIPQSKLISSSFPGFGCGLRMTALFTPLCLPFTTTAANDNRLRRSAPSLSSL